MAGNTNFPTTLDDNTSLLDATDGVSAITAAHHNNMKEAVKALEAKVGVRTSSVPTSMDYRLGDPTGGHSHNGASGQGPRLNPTMLYPRDAGDGYIRHMLTMTKTATMIVGSNVAPPLMVPKTLVLESVQGALGRGASGATLAWDFNVNQPAPSSLWNASQGLRPIFAPGATTFRSTVQPLVTVPSGAMITWDVDAVGSSDPGRDGQLTFVFRE